MADYTFLWQRKTLDENVGMVLDHAAGEQLKKLEKNDCLWIVGSYGKRLFLAGSLLVAHPRMKQAAAERKIGKKLWRASCHVLPAKGTKEVMELIDITEQGHRLRFGGQVSKLPADPANWAMALRQLRLLAPQSAELLRKLQFKNVDSHISAYGGLESRAVANGVRKALEGRVVERRHLESSRNAPLRRNALALAEGKCAGCARDFTKYLDDLGQRVLEVHHKQPLAFNKFAKVTYLSNLVVLCSNCHTLVHANGKRPMAISTLRNKIVNWERRARKK